MQRFATRDLAALGLLLAVVCLLFAPALAHPDQLLFGKDLYGEFFNYESFIRHALSQGQLPLWNPYNSSGGPVLADPQMGLLYPPNVLLRWLPLNAFFVAAYILHFWLAAAGTYLLCRQLALSRGASLTGSLGVALSTPLTQLIYPGHLTVLYSLAWLPMVMTLAIRSVERRRWLPHPGLVLALVLQFMAGFPQISVYTFACVAFYYGYSILWPPGRATSRRFSLEPLLEFGLVVILFLGVGALQILPTLRLAGEAGRTAGLSWDYATKGSFPVAQLGTVLFPTLFDAARDGYVPYASWFLLAMVPPAFVSRQRIRIVVFLGLLACAAMAFAIGRDLPIFALFHSIVPFFRIPSRSLFIWCLCVGVLGAIGFEVVRGADRSRQGASKKTLAYLLGLALMLAFLAALGLRSDTMDRTVGGPSPTWFGTPVWLFALLAVGFAILGAGVFSRRARPLLAVAAVGMVWVDLGSVARPLVTVGRPARYETVSAALTGLEVGRVVDLCPDMIPANRFMVMRTAVTDGYNSLFLADYTRFLGLVNGGGLGERIESWGLLNGRGQLPPRRDLLRMLNVTHVLSCAPARDRQLVLVREFERQPARWADSYVYRLRGALPRAVMTCGPTYTASREEAAEILARGIADLAEYVPRASEAVSSAARQGTDVQPVNSNSARSAAGFSVMVDPESCNAEGVEAAVRVLSRDNASGELELEVVAPVTGFLYISEAYYQERKVWIDGMQGALRRANLAFSGVEVAAGRHRVRIRYIPQSWYVGMWVSGLTLICWAGVAAVAKRWEKPGLPRYWTADPPDAVEPPGSASQGGSRRLASMPRSLEVQRAGLAKGALIAISCGILAFVAGVVFLSATAPVNRRIHVRWLPGISNELRGQTEQRLGLRAGDSLGGTTWVYEVREPTPEALQALVRDEMVEDTQGFDRETFEMPPSRIARRVLPFAVWTMVFAGLVSVFGWVRDRLIRWSG